MPRRRLVLASFAAALVNAGLALRAPSPRPGTVKLVDTAPGLMRELERRAREVGAELEHPAGGFHLRVNRQGMREDQDVRAEKRDQRILVIGDSHTYGLCENEESFANLLERALAAALPGRDVEVLNAGAGYHDFFDYLGTFEHFHDLAADLVIVVAYGGNDFSGSAVMQRYFRACPPPELGPWEKRIAELPPGAAFQETSQAIHLLNNPDDEARAVQAATQVAEELARQCRERGAELLMAYLPPPTRGQPELYADLARACREILDLDAGAWVATSSRKKTVARRSRSCRGKEGEAEAAQAAP